MRSERKNYIIIVLYGTILIACLLGFNNLYGSNTDWISQHSVIPDYFRSIFYETGNFIPDLAINLGAGQNIFNYSYYGLLSPVILVSYLLPFVDMTIYIIVASIFLYLLSGILMYRFLKNNTNDNKMSLILSLAFLSFSPLTYHFHHHIMFVWYMPFLIMALMGVDKYVSSNKSGLLMISIFLIIMTNYYYSIPSILAILLYGVYKLLEQDNFKIKDFFINVLKASIRIIIPVLMSALILIPSAYVIMNSGRLNIDSTSFLDLFYPNLKEVVYKSFSMGISAMFLLAPIGILACKKKKRGEVFLSISTLIIILIPLFMYALNGFLYIRGKVFIPFGVLAVILLAIFIRNVKEKNINYKYLGIGAFILILVALIDNYKDQILLLFILDVVISYLLVLLFSKFHKSSIIYIPLLIVLIGCTIINNNDENYVSISDYQNINTKDITSLLNLIEDDGYYRTSNYYQALNTANKYYHANYYSTSIYSSNYNNDYWEFYNFVIGNNIPYRNVFVSSGSENELFNNLMGVKYVISDSPLGYGYELIRSSGNLNLYLNSKAYPLVYVDTNGGSYEIFKELEFPYNIDYMLNSSITLEGDEPYLSNVQELNWNLEDTYQFKFDKKTKFTYQLPQSIQGKYLIISFDMDYNESCSVGDTSVTINRKENKLTCKSWLYHNKNNEFQYVLSSNEQIEELEIIFSKGTFHISNIHVYTLNVSNNHYEEIENLAINKGGSKITGKVKVASDAYVITSIPYDLGFKAYVDGKEVEIEKVNTSFVGFNVSMGTHEIEIVYHAPGKRVGEVMSVMGMIGFIGIWIWERKEKWKK